jgi:C-terminal region of Mon2 protein
MTSHLQADFDALRSEVTRFKEAGDGAVPSSPSTATPPASPSRAGSLHTRRSSHASVVATRSHTLVPGGSGGGSSGRRFSDHEEHLYFWMPLLIGLTELTFDPRPAVRISALEVLFDILTEHGACYSERFWAKVFERMLLPIFDSVQVEDVDFATFSSGRASEEASRERWLYETCSHCLHNLINLIVKFYPLVHRQVPKVLLKIRAFMLRTHHSLACVGVTAMERLISRTGPQMSPEMWDQVASGILSVAEETKPDVRKLVEFPRERYFRGAASDEGAHQHVTNVPTPWLCCMR